MEPSTTKSGNAKKFFIAAATVAVGVMIGYTLGQALYTLTLKKVVDKV